MKQHKTDLRLGRVAYQDRGPECDAAFKKWLRNDFRGKLHRGSDAIEDCSRIAFIAGWLLSESRNKPSDSKPETTRT